MKNLVLIAVLAMAASCAKVEQMPKEDPSSDAASAYQVAVARLLSDFTDNNWVVSRTAQGNPEHVGESIIWGSLAWAHMPCDQGEPLFRAIYEHLEDHDGELIRFYDLGTDYAHRPINFDGETGFYYGWAMRLQRCPGDRDALASAWKKREAYIAANGGRLHKVVTEKMPKEFTFTRDAISAAFDLRGEPSKDRLRTLELQIAAWAGTVVQQKQSCYRVHLAYRHLRTIEALGYKISNDGKDLFCKATLKADIPVVDNWCGREGLAAYTDAFVFNEWEYRHQRCGGWETPDGDGDTTPAVDYIEAMDERFNLF